MVVGVGLQSEATIKLKVELDSRNLNGIKTLLRDLTNAMNASKAVAQLDLFEKNLKDIQAQATRTNTELKKTQAVVAKIATEAQRTARARPLDNLFGGRLGEFIGDLKQAEKSMDALFRASYRLQMVGSILTRFSDNIRMFGADILKVFGEFEYNMLRAAGSLSIWYDAASRGNLGFTELTDNLINLSQQMKLFPAKDVAEALYFWGSTTGQTVNTQEDLSTATSALDKIMRAAILTNTSYEQTIKGVYSILAQFYNSSLDEAGRVTEQLFYTTQRTAAEFGDLIQSFKMVGPVASQMGVEFEELNETLGRLADLGIRGSMAGRGLRQIFIQTLRPSGPAQKAIDALFNRPDVSKLFGGKTFAETVFPEGEYVGIERHMEILARATEHLSTAARGTFLAQTSTANMLPIVTALIADQTNKIQGLATAEDKLADSGSQAAAFFERNWEGMQRSWNALSGSMQRAIEGLKITIGGIMADTLRPFIETFNEIINSVRLFIRANPEIISGLTKIGASLASLASVAGAFFTIAGSVTGLIAAIGLLWQATERFRAGIGRVVGAIGLIFVAVVDNFEYLYDSFSTIMQNINDAFDEVSGGANDFGDILQTLVTPAREFLGILVRVIAELAEFASGIFKVVGAINDLTGGSVLPAAFQLLTLFVSARILTGLAKMALGFLGVSKAVGVLNVQLTAVATKGVMNSLTGMFAGGLGKLKGIMTGFMGGSVGFAAFAVTAGMLAYDLLPPFRNIVDAVANSFRDWNSELAELSSGFGAAAPFISQLARQYGDIKNNVDLAKAAVSEFEADPQAVMARQNTRLDEANKQLTELIKQQGQATSQEQWDGLQRQIDSTNDTILKLQSNLDGLETNAPTGKLVDAAHDSAMDAAKAAEYATRGWERFNSAVTLANDTLTITQERYGILVNRIAEITGQDLMRSADTLSILGLITPENVTQADLKDIFAKYEGLFTRLGMDWYDFFGIADLISNVGDVSDQMNEEMIRAIQKGQSISDTKKLADFLTQPLTELGGLTIAAVSGGAGDFDKDVIAAARSVMTYYNEAMGNAMEGQAMSAGTLFADRLKIAKDLMIESVFNGLMPDSEDFATLVESYAISQDWANLADLFVNTSLSDGRNALVALTKGDLPGGAAIKDIASWMVEQGFATPELTALVESLAEDSGKEVGTKTMMGWARGVLEGLGTERLKMSEVRKAMKLGSTAKQIGRVIDELTGKPISVALESKRANVQTRLLARDRLNEIRQALTAEINRFAGTTRGKAESRKLINTFESVWKDLPTASRRTVMKVIGEIEKIYGSGFVDRMFPDYRKLVDKEIKRRNRQLRRLAESKPPKPPKTVATPSAAMPPTTPAAPKPPKPKPTSPVTTAVTTMVSDATEAAKPIAQGNGIIIGNSFVAKVKAAITTRVPDVQSAMIALIGKATSGATQPAYDHGTKVGEAFVGGFQAGVNSGTPNMSTLISTATNSAATAAVTGGRNVGVAWAAAFAGGVASQKVNITGSFAAATEDGKGGSPPKTGPLRNIDKWGRNVGNAWGENLAKGAQESAGGFLDFLDRSAARPSQIEVNDRKEMVLKIDIVSTDGSVDRMKRADVRRAAMEAIALADLEHYVTIT